MRRAVGRAPISGRGLRILTMDGGGMKGIATLRLIRQVSSHTRGNAALNSNDGVT